MRQNTISYAGFTPRPTGAHLAWAFAMFAAGILGAAGCGFAAGFLAESTGGPVGDLITLGAFLGFVLAGGGVLYFGLVRRYGWGLQEFGFTRPTRSLWHLTWWIPATIAAGGIGAMLIGTALGLSPSGGSSETAGFHLSIVASILIFVITVILAPLFEEIIFRRVLMDWLDARFSTWIAATVTTVAFTAAHISPAIMLYIVFLGTSLILARLWFGSLWGSFLVHAANNGLVTAIALLAL
ncbi:type II CAAX endopeptidase family protein [Corynebacterium sp.]|uniref:CPBP family intramembrane glutamic endopeptidase n=1 Tax=Corynebacterium sp. TaxID=1720 RepID=UPI00257D16C9|nr:type II CAAX endopeptidase family protein [Corynebacterium sp.]